jgi:hypothetical protein
VVTRIHTVLVDDLDASTIDVETVPFTVDGVTYTIDLSPTNRAALHQALLPYITAGRRLPKQPTRKASSPPEQRARADNAKLRAWWAQHAGTLALPAPRNHGAIPQQVRDAYRTAH